MEPVEPRSQRDSNWLPLDDLMGRSLELHVYTERNIWCVSNKLLPFSVNVALSNIPEGELLTGFAMRSDLREGVEDVVVEGRAL